MPTQSKRPQKSMRKARAGTAGASPATGPGNPPINPGAPPSKGSIVKATLTLIMQDLGKGGYMMFFLSLVMLVISLAALQVSIAQLNAADQRPAGRSYGVPVLDTPEGGCDVRHPVFQHAIEIIELHHDEGVDPGTVDMDPSSGMTRPPVSQQSI